jgi:hypothetical protein
MGKYNPYQPQILGQEWVPIRDEDLFLSPTVNTIETGHGLTLPTARTLANGRFYLNEFPSSDTFGQVFQVAVYPAGSEDLSGPIRSVIIPVNNGGVTGNASFSGGSTGVGDALADPSDGKTLTLSGGTPTDSNADLYFAMNSYSALLAGKRIVGLNFLYSALSPNLTEFSVRIGIFQPTQTDGFVYGFTSNIEAASTAGPGRPQISRLPFGEVGPFFSGTPMTTVERLPWIYTDLQRFEISHAGRLCVRLLGINNPSGTAVFFLYAALEVIYCQEQRVAVGGVGFGVTGTSSLTGTTQRYVFGTNIVPMRSMSTLALNPTLAAGDYSLVLSSSETGLLVVQNTPYPTLNAIRQLYEIPSHPGIQVNIPKPSEDHLGDTFTSTVSMVLPQISLHTSGGTLVEPHAYGRQVAAQVWGSVVAEQEIYDDVVGVDTAYAQCRFYARRFGDTTVPLSFSGIGAMTGVSAAITPADFDALTEIVDGWREVTLRLNTPAIMGTRVTTDPTFRWGATGELAGNRWEILGACAPAISGTPGNLFNLVPAANQLYTATYEPPGGAIAELLWMPHGVGSAYVSSATADDSSDAMLIFSQDPPTVTGVGLSQLSQTVTGIGLDCGSLPCCIPTGIGYQRITWPRPANTGVAGDDFNRTVAAGGWGTASDGKTWTTTSLATDFSVDGSSGLIIPTVTADDRRIWVDTGGPDQDIRMLLRIADTSEGTGSLRGGVVGRLTDGSNYYGAELWYTQTNTVELHLRKRVAGVQNDVGAIITVPGMLPAPTAWRWIRLQIQGSALRAKVWGLGDDEPAQWMVQAVDTALTTGNNAGGFARDDTTAVAPSTFMYDSFSVGPPDYGFGAYELQRFDAVVGDFQTIMLASSPTVTGFNDFEARVGIDSVYRLRMLNVYNFAGAWSGQVTGAPPTPGVSGGCGDATGALIFTSNADQSGMSNAAYVMQWDGSPVEDFSLPEGDGVSFQPMYGRDGVVAFHGTERGLETFARTLLIHAGAIDPARLANTHTLRDLAWADLPYVCVRDDVGDRWFANVRVPNVAARVNRTKYMARVDIVELTTTPYPVDP